MTGLPVMPLRRQELSRRIETLPNELAAWRARSTDVLDMNAHFSQLQALEILVDALVAEQREALKGLDPDGDPGVFQDLAFQLVKGTIKSQRVWDFFRDMLELRFSPDFKDALWAADTIAWDCYRPVMDRAVAAGIVPAEQVREPPLSYLTAEFSPATWVRGSRPNDGRDYALGIATLPIPVIEIPWDHMGNLWELVSLQHEVGHDLEADLKLRQPLLVSLNSTLAAKGVPEERIKVWMSWEGETFADLIGLQQGGSAFAQGLMHILLLPHPMVVTFDPGDPHPTHYVRILMNAAFIRTLVKGNRELEDDGDAIVAAWETLYGTPAALSAYVGDFAYVFAALMDTPLDALNGETVRQLVPYTAADDRRIRAAAGYLRSGQNAPGPQAIAPRHCVSAARLAATAVVEDGIANPTLDVAALLVDVNTRLVQLVRDSAAPGLRAADDSALHKAFIAGFAELV